MRPKPEVIEILSDDDSPVIPRKFIATVDLTGDDAGPKPRAVKRRRVEVLGERRDRGNVVLALGREGKGVRGGSVPSGKEVGGLKEVGAIGSNLRGRNETVSKAAREVALMRKWVDEAIQTVVRQSNGVGMQ